MKFKTLLVENFLSIEKAEIEFFPGMNLVLGINLDMSPDGSESNGSGKSSLFEPIEWALWGSLSRSSSHLADSVINKVAGKNCLVKVVFDFNGRECIVQRTRKHDEFGSSLMWWVDGKEMTLHDTRGSKKELEEFLPITHSIFRYAVQVGQGMPDKFLSLSETEKQDLLCRILDLDIYDSALEKSSDHLLGLETEVSSFEKSSETLRGVIEEQTSRRNEYSVKYDATILELSAIKIERDAVLLRKEDTEVSIRDNREESKKNHGLVLEKMVVLNQINIGNSDLRKSLNDTMNEATRKHSEELSKWSDAKNNLTFAVAEATRSLSSKLSEVNIHRNSLKKLQESSKICPTCGQGVSGDLVSSRIKENIDVVLASISACEGEYSVIENDLTEKRKAMAEFCVSHKEAKEKWDSYLAGVKESCESKSSCLDEKTSLVNEEIEAIRLVISAIDAKIESLEKYLKDADRFLQGTKPNLDKKENEKVCLSERISILSEEIASSEDKVVSLILSIEKTSKNRDHWKFWKESIPNLRAAAIEEVLSYLNKRVEEYLGVFSSGVMGMELYQVPFGKKSKIKVNLRTPGGTYEMSSGGERRRIDLAVYLALSDLLYASSGVSCNILVADEIMDGLSPEGVKKFSEVLEKKARDGMCVFVVSHNPSVRQLVSFDSVITVEKLGGKAMVSISA